MAAIEIDADNWASRARLRCPQGHTYWRPQESGFFCRSCRIGYEHLFDAKTGRRIERDDVEVE